MHRALLVNDIVHTILKNDTLSATDMINFASTCSALSSPALDILWYKQRTLGPLIMCLPEDTWEIGDDGFIHLCREPLPMEWERVRLNASRIHKITEGAHYKDPPQPHSRVLHKLFTLFPPTSLFPNLYKLDFDIVSNRPEFSPDFALLRQFLSPGLEALAFSLPSGIPVQAVKQLVDTLAAQASGVRRMVISADYDGPPWQIDLPLNKMQKLNTLAVLRNTCLTRRSFAEIGCLRSLHVLGLTLDEGFDILEDSRLGDMQLELSALKNLSLVAYRLQRCTSFLLRVITPQLSNIDITYCEYATPAEVGDFVLSLHTSYLEDISVYRDSGLLQHPHSPLPSALFRPLLKFRRLTDVNFIATGQYCLDDAFMNDAAIAWPDIQELRFASDEPHTSTVTFTAVLSLASRCRYLRVLNLTFDCTQKPILPYRKEGGDAPNRTRELWPKQTALQRLEFGHSKLSEAARAPLVLAAVFPNLVDITWNEIPGVSDATPWLQEKAVFEDMLSLRERTLPDMPDFMPSYALSVLDGFSESYEVSV
ncbi:hypothetical protein DFH29DRAFT_1072105 [Suillus ampliporus]|nr:hypothetical protein DFH29DRAFT_1072105 [Suillus ampliporus]